MGDGYTGRDIGVEKSSSIDITSGLNDDISSFMSSNILSNLLESEVCAGVLITPQVTSFILLFSTSTMLKPTVASPGSMPNIRKSSLPINKF